MMSNISYQVIPFAFIFIIILFFLASKKMLKKKNHLKKKKKLLKILMSIEFSLRMQKKKTFSIEGTL